MDRLPRRVAGGWACAMVMDPKTESDADGSRALIESARDAANELASALAGTTLPQDALPGYRILREIHRGGQGVVYRAVRLATGRDVAVKVMHGGPFDGPRDVARFDREIRVLAQLRHPNIVGIHDRGAAGGCHFFVMDYIAGQALDAYIDERQPSITERLALFLKICHAVNAAHLRGVVHRDLKPSNVRIDENGEPHVLDFGLAKVDSDQGLGGSSARAMTMTGQFVGSLPWTSPEQACGATDRIDSRTDIYSLGVMLFYTLTQRFPYAVAGPMREVLTHILESAPARPGSLCREIDADLDVIVLKALEKDPARRYQSAADLAEDIRRYLHHQPIAARAPSMAYQLRTFAKRNRALVGGVVAVFIALVLGLAGTTWQALRARKEADTAEAIREFLVQDLLASARPEFAPGRKVTVEEVLANASKRIANAFEGRPQLEASIRSTLGQVYMSLGLYHDAEAQLRAAMSLLSDYYGPVHLETLRVRHAWINAGLSCGPDWHAVERSEEFLRDCKNALGEDHELTLNGLARHAEALVMAGRWGEGVRTIGDALERSSRAFGEDHPLTIGMRNEWAQWTLQTDGPRAELESVLRDVLEQARRAFGDDHPETFHAVVNLGGVLTEQRRFAEAEPLLREGYDGLRRVLGEMHPGLVHALRNLAILLREKNLIAEATSMSRRALTIARTALGDDNPTTLEAMLYLGTNLLRGGCFCEAEEVLRNLWENYRRIQGDQSTSTTQALQVYSLVLSKLGRHAQAEEGFRRANQARLDADGVGDAWCLRHLIRSLAAQDRAAEAQPFGEKLLELRREPALRPDADAYALNCYAYDLLTVEPEHLRDPLEGLRAALLAYERSDDDYHYNRFTLALAYEANGRLDEAIAFARRALAHSPLEHSTERADYEAILARCLEQTNDPVGAEEVYRDSLAARRAQSPANDHDIAVSLSDLGNLLLKHGRYTEAGPVLRECLRIQQELLARLTDESCPITLECEISRTLLSYGRSLIAEGDYATAESYLVDTYDRLSRSTACHLDYLPENAELLVDLYNNSGRPDRAMRYTTALSQSAQHLRR